MEAHRLDRIVEASHQIGIGLGLAASPSHPTAHTGPYTAARQIVRTPVPARRGRLPGFGIVHRRRSCNPCIAAPGIAPRSVELCEASAAVNDVKRPSRFGQQSGCLFPFRSEQQARPVRDGCSAIQSSMPISTRRPAPLRSKTSGERNDMACTARSFAKVGPFLSPRWSIS
jgi:hypothetical protein